MSNFDILSNVFGFTGSESKDEVDKYFVNLINEYSFKNEIGCKPRSVR